VLIEVPVMLALVAIVNRSKGWYEAGSAVRKRTMTDKVTSRPEVA
jgi:arsenite transporter